MKTLGAVILMAVLAVLLWSSPALAWGPGGGCGVRGPGAPGVQGPPLPSQPFHGPPFHGHALHGQPSPHHFDQFHHFAHGFHHGDHPFFEPGGIVVIVPWWWGYPSGYGYPISPYSAYGDSAPTPSDPPSSAFPYGSPGPNPSYSMSITPAPQSPPPVFPDTTGATSAPAGAEAATASCEEAAWVQGYYEVRVWPNGQPETFWVPPHWVC